MMPDKRREPRPAQGILGNNPTVYQIGNARALKVARSVHPVVATFKATRLASGLSQVTVAELAGYDPETISRFERGLQAISVTKFADICAVVGLALVVLPVADQPQRV